MRGIVKRVGLIPSVQQDAAMVRLLKRILLARPETIVEIVGGLTLSELLGGLTLSELRGAVTVQLIELTRLARTETIVEIVGRLTLLELRGAVMDRLAARTRSEQFVATKLPKVY